MKYRERRKKTGHQVTIATRSGEQRVTLRDVHGEGARVALLGGPELWPGMGVEVLHQNSRFPATVAWSRHGEAGLKFAVPHRPSTVAALTHDNGFLPVHGPRTR